MKNKITILTMIGVISVIVSNQLYVKSSLKFDYPITDDTFKKFLIKKYQNDYNYSIKKATLYVDELYQNDEIHGCDLNNDGILEVEVGGGYNCDTTSCGGEYYIKEQKGYRLILGNLWVIPINSYTNGFRDLRENPNDIGACTTFGLNCDKLQHYRYNGRVYEKDK